MIIMIIINNNYYYLIIIIPAHVEPCDVMFILPNMQMLRSREKWAIPIYRFMPFCFQKSNL